MTNASTERPELPRNPFLPWAAWHPTQHRWMAWHCEKHARWEAQRLANLHQQPITLFHNGHPVSGAYPEGPRDTAWMGL